MGSIFLNNSVLANPRCIVFFDLEPHALICVLKPLSTRGPIRRYKCGDSLHYLSRITANPHRHVSFASPRPHQLVQFYVVEIHYYPWVIPFFYAYILIECAYFLVALLLNSVSSPSCPATYISRPFGGVEVHVVIPSHIFLIFVPRTSVSKEGLIT